MVDSDKLIKRLENMGPAINRYAKAKSERVYIEQFRKSKKALLMAEAQTNGAKTGQERETYAYKHPEYVELLEGLKKAVEIEEKHKWTLEQLKTLFEMWRTVQANERFQKDRV